MKETTLSPTRFVNIYEDKTGRFISDRDYPTYDEAYLDRDDLETYKETVQVLSSASPYRSVEKLDELFEQCDEPTIQGSQFYLRGFKDGLDRNGDKGKQESEVTDEQIEAEVEAARPFLVGADTAHRSIIKMERRAFKDGMNRMRELIKSK